MAESPRESRESTAESLDSVLRSARTTLGIPRAPLSPDLNRRELRDQALGLVQDNALSDVHEMGEWGKLRNTATSLDMQKALEDPLQRQSVDMAEFVAVRDGITYSTYLPRIYEQTVSNAERYAALKQAVNPVPVSLLQQEPSLRLIMQTLDERGRQRLAFSNAVLLSIQLQSPLDLKGDPQRNQDQIRQRLEREILPQLDAASRADLARGDAATLQKRMNQLDQQIVDLIARDGHVPGVMLLELLAAALEDNVQREKVAVRRTITSAQEKQYAQLRSKNDAASAGNGPPLDQGERSEFERLRALAEAAQGASEPIRAQRRQLTATLHETLDTLGDFHMEMTALTVLRHQFKGPNPLEETLPLSDARTPDEVRRAMDEVMVTRKEFHLARLDRYVERFESEVLAVDFMTRVEDFSNKSGREFLRVLINSIAAIYTLPVPEALEMKDRAQRALAGPLAEAMGWPADQLDVPFQDLDSAAQQTIMEKMTSIQDLVDQFDRNSIRNVRETIAILRTLPASKEAAGEEVIDPLPPDRVTQKNMHDLIRKHGLATVTVMALRQLDADLDGGDEDGPEGGFMAEQRRFFEGINANIDTHFDVAAALYEQGAAWRDLIYAILAAAGGGALIKLWNMWKTRSLRRENARLLAENQSLRDANVSLTGRANGLSEDVVRHQGIIEHTHQQLSSMQNQLDAATLQIQRQQRLEQLRARSTTLSLEFDEAFRISDPAQRQASLARCVANARTLQSDLNLLEVASPGARRTIAQEIFREYRLPLQDDVWSVIEQMHNAQSIDAKVRIMRQAQLSSDQKIACRKLLRMGIAGETTVTDQALELVETVAANQSVGKVVSQVPGHVLDEAAAVSEEALRAKNALKAARASKLVAGGLIAVEVFVDLYLLADVQTQLDAARKVKDAALVTLLENRKMNLQTNAAGSVALGAVSVMGASGWVTGPGAIALGGGSWYADSLYEHAHALQTSAPTRNVHRTSAELLHALQNPPTARMTDGKDTTRIMRANYMEALLRKHVVPVVVQPGKEADAVSAAVRPAMVAVDYLTRTSDDARGSFDLTDRLNLHAKPGGVDIVKSALQISRVFALRDALRERGGPMIIRYSPRQGTEETIDLTPVPAFLTAERNADNARVYLTLWQLSRQIDRYELHQLRSGFIARGAVQSALTDEQRGWNTAKEWIRPQILKRLAPAIMQAEMRVQHAFSGPGWDMKRDAALFELRMDLLDAVVPLLDAMMQPDRSLDDLQKIEERIENDIFTLEPASLLARAETQDMLSPRFNVIKYAMDHIDTSFGGSLHTGANIHDRLEPIRAARNSMEKQLGMPLEQCVSALID